MQSYARRMRIRCGLSFFTVFPSHNAPIYPLLHRDLSHHPSPYLSLLRLAPSSSRHRRNRRRRSSGSSATGRILKRWVRMLLRRGSWWRLYGMCGCGWWGCGVWACGGL